MTTPQRTPTATLVNNLLDSGYERASRQVLAGIAQEMQSGIVNQRLRELEEHATQLQANGERLRADDPVLRALLADLETVQRRNQERIRGASSGLTEAGVDAGSTISRELTFAGMSDNVRNRIGVQWNRPDPVAVASLVDFTQDPAFADMLSGFGADVINRLTLRATFGFTNGWGAVRSARALRLLAENLPQHQANTIMRTMHLMSYRRGTAATHAANARILQPEAIRIAVLDARTCLSCVALHGRRVPLGQPVADHWQGRCTVIAQVRGMNRDVQSGTDWFNSLPPERQQQQYSFLSTPAKYEAFRRGAVTLDDFVAEATDPLFGEMVFEASLKGVLGDDARQYYTRRT